MTLRIVSQPTNGTVSLSGTQATYFPYAGFAATVSLTVTANWDNYGEGSPGALGVPDLSLGAIPHLGSVVPIHFGNSSGIDTYMIVLVGSRPGYQPTPFGGTRLIADAGARVLPLPAGGGTRGYHVPVGSQFVGHNFILQTMVADPSVPGGYAFSRALRMVWGL